MDILERENAVPAEVDTTGWSVEQIKDYLSNARNNGESIYITLEDGTELYSYDATDVAIEIAYQGVAKYVKQIDIDKNKADTASQEVPSPDDGTNKSEKATGVSKSDSTSKDSSVEVNIDKCYRLINAKREKDQLLDELRNKEKKLDDLNAQIEAHDQVEVNNER